MNRDYNVFFSYNWRDREAVEAVARAIREWRLAVFLDRWYLVPGRPWPEALEETLRTCHACAVFLGPYGLGRWQSREMYLALNRQASEPAFPVIPVLLPNADPALGFLTLNTWVDLRYDLADPVALEVLVRAVRGEPPGPDLQEQVAETLATVCPYRGLRHFREEDAPFFFGREVFTKQLLEAVKVRRLVAVVGPSGSGKSSVVFAGPVPAMRKVAPQGSVWDVACLTPGDRPLHALAAALLPLLEPELSETDRLIEVGKLAPALAEGTVNLRDAVERLLEKQPGTDRLLLVADQFEELYTLCRDEAVRRRFLDELLEATEYASLTVLLTLRGDFYGQALAYRPFADRLQGAVVNLGPMTREELEQAVVQPALKVRREFETGLVERILDDVGEEPGNLPLLEFALTELWARQTAGGMLTHAAYEKIGRVGGAIAQRAEEVHKGLEAQGQGEAVRRVFLRLVRPGLGTEDTRRRATLTEIKVVPHVAQMVKALADARLVVTGRDGATGEETVEMAHETLIQGWARLRSWVEADREFLTWRQGRLEPRLQEWEQTGQDEGALLRGAALVDAERWLEERGEDLSSVEREYIKAGLALRERERKAERLRQREIRVRRWSIGLWIFLMALASLAAVLSLVSRETERSAVRATATVAEATAQARAETATAGAETAMAALDSGSRATADFRVWQTAQAQATAAYIQLMTATPQPGETEMPSWGPTAIAAVETATAAVQSLQIAEQKVVAVVAELKATATAAASATAVARELREQLQTAGLTGRGVKVAILSTGIDATHPDLAGRIAATEDFVGEGIEDGNGFGTFLAGIVAGNGVAGGGLYKGLAPEADLYIAKVTDANGAATLSDVIAGIEWAIEQQVDIVLVDVVASTFGCDGSDELSQKADAAMEAGLVVVVPAGNSGPELGTVGAPGCARLPITVGAAKLNTVADFSSRGPTLDGRTKPDILFSGSGVGARAAGTETGTVVALGYVEFTSSSVSAAQAAGAVALLLQADPDLTPAEVKDLLMETATDLGFELTGQGAGLADIEEALNAVRRPPTDRLYMGQGE